MGALLPHAIALMYCCGECFEPVAPFTTREVESGWGEPVNGLSLMAATDVDTVQVGAALKFEIFFRFGPLDSDGRVEVLNTSDGEESWLLFFVQRDGIGSIGSRVHARRPYRTGMPAFGSAEDHVDLRWETPRSRGELFFLLSEEGQSIPAGDYVVHLVYRNTGEGVRTFRNDDDGCPSGEPYPPGVFWSGSVGTPLFPLYVAARVADTTRCELPTGVRLVELPQGQLAWGWDADSFEPAEIVSRPGYHVGYRVETRTALEAEPVYGSDPATDSTLVARRAAFFEYRTGVLGGLPPLRGGGMAALTWPSLTREILREGERLRIQFDVTIFETSVPGGHLWRPEGGDYRALREYRIVEAWPK
jgi:hypothetical protein